jgi:hypothetical protein
LQTETKTNRASEDLTVVLFKGNGSPRSFRISLPALHRSLTLFGFFLAVTILGTLTLIGVSIFPKTDTAVKPATAPVTESTESASSVWDQFKGAVSNKSDTNSDSELQKEVSGLREDIAKLNSQLDHRQELPVSNPAPLLSFFGPRSTLIPEAESIMRVRNAVEVKESSNKQIYLDFELHNVDPQQRQVKGYIVTLAKTTDAIVTYPSNVFAPSQNIFLDFTRGETFAVSRFRQARANFSSPALEGAKKIFYQIIIFGTDGKVLSNIHVEGNK